jgi:hypothetical protein
MLCVKILGGSETLDSEIYEIDYKGPETHSFVPPHDKPHNSAHHHKTSTVVTKPHDHVYHETKGKFFHFSTKANLYFLNSCSFIMIFDLGIFY